MRTLTYYVATSLDGFIAGPEGQIDAFTFPEALAAHLIAHYPETLPAPARAAMGISDVPNVRFDTVVMGRETYEIGSRQGLMSPYPSLRQIVVSRTLSSDLDPAIEVVERLTPENFDAILGEEGGEVWLCGGSILAGCLRERIDRLIIKRQPIVLGSGRPLFEGSGYHLDRFALVDRTIAGDVSVETFERVGR